MRKQNKSIKMWGVEASLDYGNYSSLVQDYIDVAAEVATTSVTM
jgi:hypothetical protein